MQNVIIFFLAAPLLGFAYFYIAQAINMNNESACNFPFADKEKLGLWTCLRSLYHSPKHRDKFANDVGSVLWLWVLAIVMLTLRALLS